MLVKKKTIRTRTRKCQINDRECKLSNMYVLCTLYDSNIIWVKQYVFIYYLYVNHYLSLKYFFFRYGVQNVTKKCYYLVLKNKSKKTYFCHKNIFIRHT